MEAWENPTYSWPPIMPRPTRHRSKTLLNQLMKEEKERQSANRDLELPDWRTGDVVKFTLWNSLSEKTETDYSGVVIGKRSPNNINAKCVVCFMVEGTMVTMGVNLYSPMLKSFYIERYGSNKLRKKLNHIPKMEIPAGRLQEPIVKGVGFTPRSTQRVQKQKQEQEKKSKITNKGKYSKLAVKLETPYN